VKILLDQTINFGTRQLAGVLFKQYVEIHWSLSSEKYKEPEMEQQFKIKIKQILPLGLADQESKIRITVAHAIATIAHWDWPEQWPELFPTLIQGLSGNDLFAIHGSIKTLSEFIDEVTDIQMPHIAPTLMPQIYNIFINPQHYSIRLRSRSIEIFNSLINVIAEMSEYDTVSVYHYLNNLKSYYFFSF
jgi:importin-9